jgi:hypothetical protein
VITVPISQEGQTQQKNEHREHFCCSDEIAKFVEEDVQHA